MKSILANISSNSFSKCKVDKMETVIISQFFSHVHIKNRIGRYSIIDTYMEDIYFVNKPVIHRISSA